MELGSKTKILKIAVASLVLAVVAASCAPVEASKENYKRAAIDECKKEPAGVAYDNCINRAKMEADEFDIETDKKLKPQ